MMSRYNRILQYRYFWFWFALLQTTVIVCNLIGTREKRFRFFGLPFTFASLRPGLPNECEFEPIYLLLDAIVGFAVAFFAAWGLTGWHFRKPIELSPDKKDSN